MTASVPMWDISAHAFENGARGDCEVLRDERKAKAFAMVRKIAEQMKFGEIPRHRHDKELLCIFANQINEVIKEFVKGEPNA